MPISHLKNDKPDWSKLPGLTDGMLTPRGIEQAQSLGRYLRQEYITKHKLISENYEPLEVYARSTNLHRTMLTGAQVLSLLFENNTRHDDIDDKPVFGFAGVPLTMVDWKDELLQANDFCPKVKNTLLPQLFKSEMWVKKETENKEFLKWLQELTGADTWNLSGIGQIYDAVYVEHTHGVLTIQELNNQTVVDQLSELMGWAEYQRSNAGNVLNGGPLVARIGADMDAMVTGTSGTYKYIHHSGHDTTILALLTASGLGELNPTLQAVPRYASLCSLNCGKRMTTLTPFKLDTVMA
jgi:hypothetical protein